MYGNMQTTLFANANIIDINVKAIEQRCAKLMTILKPIYSMANLNLPQVPAPRLLSSYPSINLNLESIKTCNMKSINLVLFRSLRKLNQINNSCEVKDGDSHIKEVYQLIDTILEEYSERYNDEISKRIQRKAECSIHRVKDIDEYKINLINTLHERRILSREDKTAMRYYKEQFRFPDSTEPIIFQTNASYCSKKGVLIITGSHICFYSSSTLETLQNAFITSFLSPVAPESLHLILPFSVIHAITNQSKNGIFSNDIVITDLGNNRFIVNVKGPTEDFAQRVCDTLNIIISLDLNSFRNSVKTEKDNYDLGDIYGEIVYINPIEELDFKKNDNNAKNESERNICNDTSSIAINEASFNSNLKSPEDNLSKKENSSIVYEKETKLSDTSPNPKNYKSINPNSIAAKLASLRAAGNKS